MTFNIKRSFGTVPTTKSIFWRAPHNLATDSWTVDDAYISAYITASGNSFRVREGTYWGTASGSKRVQPVARAKVIAVSGSTFTIASKAIDAFLPGLELFDTDYANVATLLDVDGDFQFASTYYGASQGTIVSAVEGPLANQATITMSGAVTAVAGDIVTSKHYIRGIAAYPMTVLDDRPTPNENCLIALYQIGELDRDNLTHWDESIHFLYPKLTVFSHGQYGTLPAVV